MLWFVDDDGTIMVRVRGRIGAMRSFLEGLVESAPLVRAVEGRIFTVPDNDAVVFKGSIHPNDVASMREYLMALAMQLKASR